MSKEKSVLTARQAGELLGVDRQTVIRWIDEGVLSAWLTEGGHHRLERAEVERYKETRRVR